MKVLTLLLCILIAVACARSGVERSLGTHNQLSSADGWIVKGNKPSSGTQGGLSNIHPLEFQSHRREYPVYGNVRGALNNKVNTNSRGSVSIGSTSYNVQKAPAATPSNSLSSIKLHLLEPKRSALRNHEQMRNAF